MSNAPTERHKALTLTGAIDALLGLLVVCATIYLMPAMIGHRKRNAAAIFVFNLLLGWTLVGLGSCACVGYCSG